jgi:hypothetical protein
MAQRVQVGPQNGKPFLRVLHRKECLKIFSRTTDPDELNINSMFWMALTFPK